MYIVKFHLTDECNIRCKNCHWFSQPVNPSGKMIGYTDYLTWIDKNMDKIKFITLSGGEPTLYPDFLKLINHIPETLKVRVYSNGTNPHILKQITRKNLELVVSRNRKVDAGFEERIRQLNRDYRIQSFNQEDSTLADEVKFGENESNFHLIGKTCLCKSRGIRFGADGYAYNCETGLRSKNGKYRTGLSLWNGVPGINELKCTIQKECLSNFLNENKYEVVSRYSPFIFIRLKRRLKRILFNNRLKANPS